MNATELAAAVAALPKAELHLHLEGSIAPETVVRLAARYGVEVSAEEVAARYRYSDFAGFLDAYKWVTSFLRRPADYRLIAEELFDRLIAQNVVYAEITLSCGVMLRRGQDVETKGFFRRLDQAAGPRHRIRVRRRRRIGPAALAGAKARLLRRRRAWMKAHDRAPSAARRHRSVRGAERQSPCAGARPASSEDRPRSWGVAAWVDVTWITLPAPSDGSRDDGESPVP